MYIISV